MCFGYVQIFRNNKIIVGASILPTKIITPIFKMKWQKGSEAITKSKYHAMASILG